MLNYSVNTVFDTTFESATLSINQRVKAMREQGLVVSHFGFGESPFPIPPQLAEGLRSHAEKKAYLPTAGLKALRESVARFFEAHFDYAHFDSDAVFIGPGSKELLFQLLFVLEGEVLIPRPSWVSYLPQVKLLQKDYSLLETSIEHNYCLQANTLEAHCTKNSEIPKILILNSPNNPTGAVYNDENVRALAKVCREYGVTVISDEIYSLVRFNNEPYRSIAHDYPEGTIVTSGLSKIFSAGGFRLGYALVPNSMVTLRQALHVMISETFSAVAAPIQYAALEMFSCIDELKSYLSHTRTIHAYAAKLLASGFDAMGVRTSRPEGAFYLLVNFSEYREFFKKEGIQDDKALCEAILEKCGVAILPGSDFYLQADAWCARVATVDYDGAKLLRHLDEGGELTDTLFPSLIEGLGRLGAWLGSSKA